MYISTCIKVQRVGGMTLNTPKKHEVNWEIVLLLVISLFIPLSLTWGPGRGRLRTLGIGRRAGGAVCRSRRGCTPFRAG